jgi:hypothetical protein
VSQPNDTGYLGSRQGIGELSAANKNVPGAWVVTFKTQDLYPIDFEIYHIAMRGPTGNLLVYIDESFYSAAPRTDVNEYDPKQPMFVRRGQEVSFHLSSVNEPVPQIWIYARLPGDA